MSTTDNRNYYTQLDFLRALSVSMVIFSHWAGYHQYLWEDNIFWFNGEIGVKIFFVISGFLITGILLNERNRTEQIGRTKSQSIKTFYIRRFLRIFPIYYFTLFVLYGLGHPDVVRSIGWHLSYLSNIFFAVRGEYLGDVSHFWSLAVEEQFYLVWPFVVFFISRRYLFSFMVICMITAPLFRFLCMFVMGWNDVTSSVLPFSSLDCLAGGSLLALMNSEEFKPLTKQISGIVIKRMAVLSGILFLAAHFIHVAENHVWHLISVQRILLVPMLMGIVMLFVDGFKGVAKTVSEFPPFLYIGKISYGIYIFHFFIPWLTLMICNQFGLKIPIVAMLAINVAVLLMVSALSWHLFEKPINEIKKYFDYSEDIPFPSRTKFVSKMINWDWKN